MKVKTKLCAAVLALALGCGVLAGCQLPGANSGSQGTGNSSQTDQTKYLVNVSASNDYTVAGLEAEGYLAGAKVTFTVTPAEGKEVVSVGYDQTDLTAKADGSYEFDMPAKNVTLIVSVRTIETYALTHTGSIKVDGDPVAFSLKLGTDPVTEFELVAVEGAEHVTISGHNVTGVSEGQVTVAAKISNEEKARETFTVEKSAYTTLAAAIQDAWTNVENFNDNSKSTTTTNKYKVRAKVMFMGNPYTSGNSTTVEMLLDDGTAIIDYSIKSSVAITAFAVGDVIEIEEPLQNYKGLMEMYSSDVKYAKKVEGVTITPTAFTDIADAAAYDTHYNTYVANDGIHKITPVTLKAKAKLVGEGTSAKKRYEVAGAQKGLLATSKSVITLAFEEGAEYNFKGYLMNWNDSSTAKYTNFVALEQTKQLANSVQINEEDFELAVNTTKQLTYTTNPVGSGRVVAWSVQQSGNFVTVSDSGLVEGKAAGSAVVKVTVDGKEDTVNVIVIEPVAATSAQFSEQSIEMTNVDTYDLNTILTSSPENNSDDKNKQWSVAPEGVVTVDKGVLTPVASGTATVTVKYNNSVSASISVTVREQKISDLAHAKVGQKVDLYGYITGKYPADNVFGMWIADGASGIAVNVKPTAEMVVGKIVHVVGEVQVSRYFSNGNPVYTGAKEIGPAETNGVTVVESHTGLNTPTVYALNEQAIANLGEADFGKKATVTGKVTEHSGSGNNNQTITLSVGAESFKVYAQKSSMGDVSDFDRAAVGTTATFTGFISAYKSAKVDFDFSTLVKGDFQMVNPTIDEVVVPTATGIKLDKTTADVEQGKTLQLNVSANPEGAQLPATVVWAVSGNDKVTVSQTGLVTVAADASTADKATVSATCGTFEPVTCVITVKAPTVGTSDVLNRELTGISGTSYSDWSDKSGTSGAKYTGNSAGGNDSIQLRKSNDSQAKSGIISTTSGGKVAKVIIAWNSNTVSGRTLNVYGSNTAYTAVSQLYGNTAGTKLGTIVCGTSTELTITGDYAYIGLVSNGSAMYIDSITIVWVAA